MPNILDAKKSRRKTTARKSSISGGVGGSAKHTFSVADWSKFEQLLKKPLTEPDREKITNMIIRYLDEVNCEISSPVIDKEVLEIAQIKAAAISLRSELLASRLNVDRSPHTNEDSRAAHNARIRIRVRLQEMQVARKNAYDDLIRQLAIISECCSREINKMDTEDGWEEGVSWNTLIATVDLFFKDNKSPKYAPKDGRSSIYLRFIGELHQIFPETCRRWNKQTEATLGQAIARARASNVKSRS